MSKGINKCIILGRLGKDPEIKVTEKGLHIANFSIATSENWKDKTTGENKENTEWHRIVLFNKLAEIAGEYLKKGSQVYVEGKLQTRKWQDKEGNNRYTTEIVGGNMQMIGSASDKRDPNSFPETYSKKSVTAPQPIADFDDEIPF